MKKLILGSVAAIALFGVAACSDTDDTTTQSVQPPATEEPAPITPAPATPEATPPATDNSTTQSITPTPETGTDDEMQNHDTMQPKPVEPAAPAQ
ncbi:hypothetical protein [Aminobacter niigataensis]|uniref:hypothetical protein n=1 Tax=Aminobacter niigataensis TaxID=83265 RepID=UPI0024C7E4F5|nr:hypothetical protein [Aminobacter niigataensis]CAI2933961.1 conserved exported protein of unknown function [Aminobacter niigataensis]